jgi:hypothetical protein
MEMNPSQNKKTADFKFGIKQASSNQKLFRSVFRRSVGINNVLLLTCALLFGCSQAATSFTNSYSDCLDYAAMYLNTCTDNETPAASVDDLDTETVTCYGGGKCPDGSTPTANTPCTWERSLCVTCRESAGKVFIRV